MRKTIIMRNPLNKIIHAIVVLLIINCIAGFSQTAFVHNVTRNPPFMNNRCFDIAATLDGGYGMVSDIWDPNGDLARSITKVDSSGNVIWSNYYNPFYDHGAPGRSILTTSDSGFYLCVMPFYNVELAWKISKIDKFGNVVWTILDPEVNWESRKWVMSFKKDKYSDNIVVVAGRRDLDGSGNTILASSYIKKYNANGSLLFSKEFEQYAGANYIDYLYNSKGYYNASGNLTNYLVTGKCVVGSGSFLCLINLSPTGSINWMKNYAGSAAFDAFVDQTKLNNNYYLLSATNNVYKINTNGNPLFSIAIDSVKAYKLETADSNHILIMGYLGYKKYPVIIEINASGTITNAKYSPAGFFNCSNSFYNHFNFDYNENTKAIFVAYTDSSGEEYVEKFYLNNSCTFRDTVLNYYTIPVLTDFTFTTSLINHSTLMDTMTVFPFADSVSVVCYSTTGISEQQHSQSGFYLFPNPTTDFITIHYNLYSSNQTTVSLFNLYGQPLATPLTPKGGLSRSDDQEIKIDMRSFPAGIYFVKVSDGEKAEVRKVVKY